MADPPTVWKHVEIVSTSAQRRMRTAFDNTQRCRANTPNVIARYVIFLQGVPKPTPLPTQEKKWWNPFLGIVMIVSYDILGISVFFL